GVIDKVLADNKVGWKYRGLGYDARLAPALDALEWGQYAQGIKLLAPARRSGIKVLSDSANKLLDAVKEEGEAWKAEAENWVDYDPVQAYDCYAKVSAVFAGDELAKSVAEPMKKLAADKAVGSELAARRAFAPIEAGLGQATPAQKPLAIKALQDFAKRYPGTPTADKAAALAKELSN